MPAKEVIKWISSYKGFSSWENIKPINDYERTVLYSSIEHKGWIKSIEDFLNNKNKKLPQLDGSKCHLGKWIIDSELTTPNFLQLESLHNELHNYAKELLLLNTDARKEGIEKLKNLGNKISEVLNSIIFEKESTK